MSAWSWEWRNGACAPVCNWSPPTHLKSFSGPRPPTLEFSLQSLRCFTILPSILIFRTGGRAAKKNFLYTLAAVFTLLAFTNEWHGWVWPQITPNPAVGLPIIFHHGPAYWGLVIFIYLLLSAATLFLIMAVIPASKHLSLPGGNYINWHHFPLDIQCSFHPGYQPPAGSGPGAHGVYADGSFFGPGNFSFPPGGYCSCST